MGQEINRSSDNIIRNPTGYEDMIAKLKQQEERSLAGVLNKHKVSAEGSSQPVSSSLVDIAKKSVEARASRAFTGTRPETSGETRLHVARDVIKNSSDPEVNALKAQLDSEIERSRTIASRANVTHPPRGNN